MDMRKQVELLAPAGSFESLQAAIQAGADAVFFGMEQLNMRARAAKTFTLDDLPELVQRCKANDLKCYLTLNTIIYDHDISLMRNIIREAANNGVDAVIAMDPAVMQYACENNMPVHISTQANISNIEAISFYSRFADVMVLARELTLSQIRQISHQIEKRQIKGPSGNLVKVEAFAHGAFCMAVSGICYLSLHTDLASANRGACVQNCRRKYTVTDEEGNSLEVDNEYIMSPRDLCTIDILDQLTTSGISILKLEGRARAPEYVYEVTKCYREGLEALEQNTFTAGKIKEWKNRLSKVYNRGFWHGYYPGKPSKDWQAGAYGSQARQQKIYLGKGLHYFDNLRVAEFKMEAHHLKKEDSILITGPTTGLVKAQVNEIRVNDKNVEQVSKGTHFSIPVPRKIRESDKLYKIVGSS